MTDMVQDAFERAAEVLYEPLKGRITAVPEQVKNIATEIRLRSGLPLMLNTISGPIFLLQNGDISHHYRRDAYWVSAEEVEQSFRKICGYSVHSYQNEIQNGYLTVNGNRIGFCGTAVVENGAVTTLRKITSLNIRIARQVCGSADPIISLFAREGLCGALILGAPASGKTTMLKDMIRQLADGSFGHFVQISVIDERGELAGECGGGLRNQLGMSVDVLSGYPKAKGMEIAVRTMAPELLVCDEIGNQEDAAAVLSAVHSGVRVVASMHAGSIEEFIRKPLAKAITEAEAFHYVFVLDGSGPKCSVKQIFSSEQWKEREAERREYVQAVGSDFCCSGIRCGGISDVLRFHKKSE